MGTEVADFVGRGWSFPLGVGNPQRLCGSVRMA